MAGINNAISDITSRLERLVGFCRIWNNQLKYMEEQKIESFPFPCSFVEVVVPQDHSQLASGYTESDVKFRIHLGQVEYDAMDGTLEQNTSIFALRDSVVASLTYFEPTGCNRLMKIEEEQDYQHTNVYHYIITFTTSFIDTTGGIVYQTTTPPTGLQINVSHL
jgi:hypothetical protein